MQEKSKKAKGKKLEYLVADKLNEIGIKARVTRNSGGSTEIADILNEKFYFECKNWNRYNLIINIKDWNHLLSKMPINTNKIPVYVFQNNEGRKWATLDLEDFFKMLEKIEIAEDCTYQK